ncbi:MAG: hypothetical protein ABI588_09690, partial [Arenimonas sp.]
MAALVGVVLALAVSLFAKLVGLDKDRAFYPTVLAVVASYYDLFAVMGGSAHVIGVELAITVVFLLALVAGFRRSPWIIVGALAAHGLLDLMHARVIVSPGVPDWWPAFCLAYDVTAAACLAWLVKQRSTGSPTAPVLMPAQDSLT